MLENIIWIITIVVIHVLGPLSALHAVFYSPSSQGAIAWAIALITFPYVALPWYWVAGRSRFSDYTTARKEGSKSLQELGEKVSTLIEPYRVKEIDSVPELLAAEHLAHIPVLSGNEIELLIDGEETFRAIFQGIDSAASYLLVQFFIVNDDELGRELKQRLIAKAQEGVVVHFLYDRIGSKEMSRRFLKDLKAAGVHCFDFNAQKGPRNRLRINFRNHRKIVVVDGHTAWIGGHNVGDEYLGKGKLGAWRDTHMRVSGPSVIPIQLSFAEDWHWATGSIPDLSWTPVVSTGETPVLILPTGPGDLMDTAGLMFVHAIHSAKERIWIASPYFVPNDAVICALQLAGLRGVDVRIIIPENPDHYLVYMAAFSYLKDAGATGVKFYRYEEGFMHQKVMLIDSDSCAVGTANMDNRSFKLNFEITGFVISEAFNKEMEQMFNSDFARSRLVDKKEYKHYPFWFTLRSRLARLFAPLL